MARTRNQYETDNVAGNNNQLPQSYNDMVAHSKSSVSGRAAESNRQGEIDLLRHLTKEQLREVALNCNVASTITRLLKEQQNDMANHIVSQMSDVIKSIAVNAINDEISRPGSSKATTILGKSRGASAYS